MRTTQDKQDYVADTLYHELRCLLGATTVWQIFKSQAAGFDVTVAMDSAFVHARNLYNFFTEPKGGNDISVTAFGPSAPYPSTIYDTWREALHRQVLHVSKGRTSPTNLKDGAHLNEQVEVFARDILSLWCTFESDPAAANLRSVLKAARKRAIEDAANDSADRSEPLFNFTD